VFACQLIRMPAPSRTNRPISITMHPQCPHPHMQRLPPQVEAGFDTLALLEGLGSNSGTPSEPIAISDCGEAGAGADPEQLVEEFRAAAAAAAAREEQEEQQQQDAAAA